MTDGCSDGESLTSYSEAGAEEAGRLARVVGLFDTDLMLVRRETGADQFVVSDVTAAAFATDDGSPVGEVPLLQKLRDDEAFRPELSLVAARGDDVVGHVIATRGFVDDLPALGLGPISVLPADQRVGVGTALMHAVLGAAEAMGEPLVVLLGDPGFYERFGFVRARTVGVNPPEPGWDVHFLARPLTAWVPGTTGTFRYARPFTEM